MAVIESVLYCTAVAVLGYMEYGKICANGAEILIPRLIKIMGVEEFISNLNGVIFLHSENGQIIMAMKIIYLLNGWM